MKYPNSNDMKKRMGLILLLLVMITTGYGQALTVEEAVQSALQNNLKVQSAGQQVEVAKEMKRAATDIGKLSVDWMYGQFNSAFRDNSLELTQSLPFPGTLIRSVKLGAAKVRGAENLMEAERQTLMYEVRTSHERLLYLKAVAMLLQAQDSVYGQYHRAAELRYNAGEGTLLETTTAQLKWHDVKNQIQQNGADIEIERAALQNLLNSVEPVSAVGVFDRMETPEDTTTVDNARLIWSRQQITINQQAKKLERSRLLPDFSLGYFNISNTGFQNYDGTERYYGSSHRFQGIQLGISIPLWVKPQLARARAAAHREQIAIKNAEYYSRKLSATIQQTQHKIRKNAADLQYYEERALANANQLLHQSRISFQHGDINFKLYLEAQQAVHAIKTDHLRALHQHNQSIIQLHYLLGK